MFVCHRSRSIASYTKAISILSVLSFVLLIGACSAQDKQECAGCTEADNQQIVLPDLDEVAQPTALNRLVIHYDVDGQLEIESKPHTLESLKSSVEAALADDEFIQVIVRVEAAVLYSDILPVIETIESSGYKSVIHLIAYQEDD